MSILTRFRDRRRQRIISKYLNTNGMALVRRPQRIWYPHWLRSDYTMRNSELIFAAVSRIANSLSAMPISLYKGDKKWQNEVSNLVSLSPNPSMTSCVFFRTLEACRCIGACGLAPAMSIDATVYPHVKADEVKGILQSWYDKEAEEAG